MTGIEEEVIHYGKVVGVRRKRSDAVFRMILQASDPEKYGRQGEVMRARIEKELRPKIEAEVRAEIEAEKGPRRDAKAIFDELAERIQEMEREEIEKEAERTASRPNPPPPDLLPPDREPAGGSSTGGPPPRPLRGQGG